MREYWASHVGSSRVCLKQALLFGLSYSLACTRHARPLRARLRLLTNNSTPFMIKPDAMPFLGPQVAERKQSRGRELFPFPFSPPPLEVLAPVVFGPFQPQRRTAGRLRAADGNKGLMDGLSKVLYCFFDLRLQSCINNVCSGGAEKSVECTGQG
ncbi:hypothetical protein N658DRAFT_497733 [Parathielavia hyrcaniae]|uniref:Uncharacterized protein n=1 Tax=Parathielavia hyrcaniae TaxID=113614 RepID=A0AAN6Q300_9PEZI|nr:hypothetical protein N658DRAFT_497733 [Parathielavia hyrcaniae]